VVEINRPKIPPVEGSPLSEAMARAREQFRSADAIGRTFTELTKNSVSSPLGDVAKRVFEQTETMRALAEPFQALSENLELERISRRIADHQKELGAIRLPEMPKMPEPRPLPAFDIAQIPPNPVHETNDRLASIEDRFDRLEGLAIDAAEIAADLQKTAVNFLATFQKAASDNDHTASLAIKLTMVAVVIALVSLVAPIVYTEWWRAPNDAAEMRAVIAEMRGEIASLREAQGEAVAATAGLTPILTDIRDVLAAQDGKPAPVSEPESAERRNENAPAH
jgi:hypothetical protein